MTNAKMTKREFIKRFKEDYGFRHEMRCKGVRVVADNVIFFGQDGTIKNVAGGLHRVSPQEKIKKDLTTE